MKDGKARSVSMISLIALVVCFFSPAPAVSVAATASYAHPGGFMTQAQIDTICARVSSGAQPWKGAYDQLISEANNNLTRTSHAVSYFYVPPYYEDSSGHISASKPFAGDSYAAYACALAYKLTGEAAYADEAISLLDAWAVTNTSIADPNSDSRLVMTYAGTGLIYAAELLYGYSGWTSDTSARFKAWVTNIYKTAADYMALNRGGNQQAWGILGQLVYAYFMDDSTTFTSAVTALKSAIDIQIASDGHLPEEANREGNGLWYHYFALNPMTAACQVVENATGEDLFHWTSPNGKQIKKALDYYLYYVQNPTQWPYYTNPGMPNPNYNEHPLNLFEAMSGVYQNSTYADYSAPHRPVLGGQMDGRGPHNFAWVFPTLTLRADASTAFFSDNFEDGDAAGWNTTGGDWSVKASGNNKVFEQASLTAAGVKAYTGDAGWLNYELSSRAMVKQFNSGSAGAIGLYVRYQDAGNFYNCQYYTAGKILKIQKCVNGVYTTLASKSFSFQTNQWYGFKVTVNGTSIHFYVDGVLQLSANSAEFSTGTIGLDSSRADCVFDFVQACSYTTASAVSDSGSIAIASPLTDSQYDLSVPVDFVITVSADAADIGSVELFESSGNDQCGMFLGKAVLSSGHYGYKWNNPGIGAHKIVAVSTDIYGHRVVSPPINVYIGSSCYTSHLVYREDFDSGYTAGQSSGFVANAPSQVSAARIEPDLRGTSCAMTVNSTNTTAEYFRNNLSGIDGKVLVTASIRPQDTIHRLPFFIFRDSKNTNESNIVEFGNDGNIRKTDHTVIQAYSAGTFYDLQMLIDVTNHTYDLYINGVKKIDAEPMPNTVFTNLQYFYFIKMWGGGVSAGTAYFDDLAIYTLEGNQPSVHIILNNQDGSVAGTSTYNITQTAQLKNASSFVLVGALWYDDKIEDMQISAFDKEITQYQHLNVKLNIKASKSPYLVKTYLWNSLNEAQPLVKKQDIRLIGGM